MKRSKADKVYLNELKRSEKRNENLGKAEVKNPRSLSAYKERQEIKRNIKSLGYTSYKPQAKMTREEFLKSIS